MAEEEMIGQERCVDLYRSVRRGARSPDAACSPDAASPAWLPIDAILDCAASMCPPRVFMVVEQEADHNKPRFLDRFLEALFYYSAVFDCLDAASGSAVDSAAEAYREREICDIMCNEGAERRERHELLRRWRDRLVCVGLAGVPLRANALRQARMLGEGHCVEVWRRPTQEIGEREGMIEWL